MDRIWRFSKAITKHRIGYDVEIHIAKPRDAQNAQTADQHGKCKNDQRFRTGFTSAPHIALFCNVVCIFARVKKENRLEWSVFNSLRENVDIWWTDSWTKFACIVKTGWALFVVRNLLFRTGYFHHQTQRWIIWRDKLNLELRKERNERKCNQLIRSIKLEFKINLYPNLDSIRLSMK